MSVALKGAKPFFQTARDRLIGPAGPCFYSDDIRLQKSRDVIGFELNCNILVIFYV